MTTDTFLEPEKYASSATCDTPPQEIQKKEQEKKIHDDSGVASCSTDLSTVEGVGSPTDQNAVEMDGSGMPLTLYVFVWCLQFDHSLQLVKTSQCLQRTLLERMQKSTYLKGYVCKCLPEWKMTQVRTILSSV